MRAERVYTMKKMNQQQIDHLAKMVWNHQGIYETKAYRYWMEGTWLVRVSRRAVGTTTFYGEREDCGEVTRVVG